MQSRRLILAIMALSPFAMVQGAPSSTSIVSCLTKLGTSSVAAPIPSTTVLRSLTINTIQSSTYTPTATSTPPDTTTTLSFTEFPTTTTTISNTETDTFSTTTTIVDQELTTATVTVTTTNTVTQSSTNYPTTTIGAGQFFIPAQQAQANQANFKRAEDALARGAVLPRRLHGRQAASASGNTNPASAYVYTEAVSCTGVVEYFSTTTKVVATATPSTTVLPVVTDITSSTETITITSSVLQTPASTTETISSTITTTSLAGTTTSTVAVATTTTVVVQAPLQTVYAGCQSNNFISTTKKGHPINRLFGPGAFGQPLEGPEAVISEDSAYSCCVACFSTYGSTCGSAAFNPATGQCLIYDGTQVTSGNFGGGCEGFSAILGYETGGSSSAYTLLDGPCGTTDDQD